MTAIQAFSGVGTKFEKGMETITLKLHIMTLVKVRKPNTVFPSMFDEFWKDWQGENNNTDWVPAANIKEEDTKYHVELSAPGYKREDIKVSVEDDTLTIVGEVKIENEEKQDNYVNLEKIDAKYEDGILRIDLPKVENEVKKLKEIKVG